MITEWILLIWFSAQYPMTNKESHTSLIVLDRFNTEDQCKKAGTGWGTLEYKQWQCVKTEKEVFNNFDSFDSYPPDSTFTPTSNNGAIK